MAQKVVIIGHALNAEIIFSMLNADPAIEIAAFSVHERFLDKENLFGKKIVPFEKLPELFPPAEYKVINAVGYSNINQNREKIYLEAKALGYTFLTYIHPSVSNFSQQIGEGVFIMAGAVIEPFAAIGANSVIWSNAVIAHHAIIDEHCWIASGVVIAGEARVKRNCFFGVNATAVNKITVEKYNIIGAHVLISKNTSPKGVYLTRSGEPHRFTSDDYAKLYLV